MTFTCPVARKCMSATLLMLLTACGRSSSDEAVVADSAAGVGHVADAVQLDTLAIRPRRKGDWLDTVLRDATTSCYAAEAFGVSERQIRLLALDTVRRRSRRGARADYRLSSLEQRDLPGQDLHLWHVADWFHWQRTPRDSIVATLNYGLGSLSFTAASDTKGVFRGIASRGGDGLGGDGRRGAGIGGGLEPVLNAILVPVDCKRIAALPDSSAFRLAQAVLNSVSRTPP